MTQASQSPKTTRTSRLVVGCLMTLMGFVIFLGVATVMAAAIFGDLFRPDRWFSENRDALLASLSEDNSYAYVHSVFGTNVKRACFFSSYSERPREEFGIDWWGGDGAWILIVETTDGAIDAREVGHSRIALLDWRCLGPQGVLISVIDPPGSTAYRKYLYPMEVEDFVFSLNADGKLPLQVDNWHRGVNRHKVEFIELPAYSR